MARPLDDLSDETRQALIRQLEDARRPVVDSVANAVTIALNTCRRVMVGA